MMGASVRELGEPRGERVLRLAGRGAQVVLILLATCIAALPLGLPAESRYVLPLLPLAIIFHATQCRPGVVPEWLAFLCGLTLDVLTQGPLGFWAFVYLSAHALALVAHPLAEHGTAWRLALLAGGIAVSAAIAWSAASLYYGEVAPVAPWGSAVLWAVPPALVVVLLRRLVGGAVGPRRANMRLEREGWR